MSCMLVGVARVSFQGNANANNGARYALTGTIAAGARETPFKKEGTQAFSCRDADEVEVAAALEKLSKVIADNANALDFVTISLVKQA